MTGETITLDDVVTAAREVAQEHPDRINPYGVYRPSPYGVLGSDGRKMCLYTSHDDPEHHCLGGAVLLRLGCRLPPEGDSVLASPDVRRLDGFVSPGVAGSAAEFLYALQTDADCGAPQPRDGGEYPRDRRLPWSEAFAKTYTTTFGEESDAHDDDE